MRPLKFHNDVGLLAAELKARLLGPTIRILFTLKRLKAEHPVVSPKLLNTTLLDEYGIIMPVVHITMRHMVKKNLLVRQGLTDFHITELGERVIEQVRLELERTFAPWREKANGAKSQKPGRPSGSTSL